MTPSDSQPPVEAITISAMLRMLARHEQAERSRRAWDRITKSEVRDFLISTGQEEAS